jgi:hypothetical protein
MNTCSHSKLERLLEVLPTAPEVMMTLDFAGGAKDRGVLQALRLHKPFILYRCCECGMVSAQDIDPAWESKMDALDRESKRESVEKGKFK